MTKKLLSKFALALAAKLKERELKPIDIERLSKNKITRQNLSRLLNDTPHPVSGALPKVKEKTVEEIAKHLDWDLDEAREAAGFSRLKKTPAEIPESIRQAIAESPLLEGKDYDVVADIIALMNDWKRGLPNVGIFEDAYSTEMQEKDRETNGKENDDIEIEK